MILSSLSLQQFRNYTKAQFSFAPGVSIIVGPNTAGKTNLLDAVHLLSTGKSFLSDREEELIRFGEEFGRIKGRVVEKSKIQIPNSKEETSLRAKAKQSTETNEIAADSSNPRNDEEEALEVLLTAENEAQRAGKRFFVNGVARRRSDFATHLPILLFTPMHLSIINSGPNQRRSFLDEVLEQTDREYMRSMDVYTKALRQRNALLEWAKETGVRNENQFQYWDELLITTGTYIHAQRQEFIDFMNAEKQHIFPLRAEYDHSVISEERLEKYKSAEMGACVTLVGPHRDEVLLRMTNDQFPMTNAREVKTFASRGQQRLAVLQLKVLQLEYMQRNLKTSPILLLDDIFSELDQSHIQLVSDMIGTQQTIITTTHEEFIQGKFKKEANVIELGNYARI